MINNHFISLHYDELMRLFPLVRGRFAEQLGTLDPRINPPCVFTAIINLATEMFAANYFFV